jgi:hypothetical protein
MTPEARQALTEALERWRLDPTDGAAAGVVCEGIDALASSLKFAPRVREEAAGRVTEEVWAKVHNGALAEPVLHAAAWLKQRLKWRALDVLEGDKPRPLPPPPPPEPPPGPFETAENLALMEQLFASAVRVREESYRAHLEAAWTLCQAWHLGPHTLQELVRASDDAVGLTHEADLRRIYDRTTRAQARLRDALHDAVDRLGRRARADGGLDEEDTLDAHRLVNELRRCPKPRPAASRGA